MTFGILALVLLAFWIAIHLKDSRPDGTLVSSVPKYRTMMFHIMPGRNESIVYYDTYAKSDHLMTYVKKASEKFGTEVDVTHALVAAVTIGIRQNPRMNQFVKGFRLYQGKNIHVTFSMKRTRMNKEAKLSAVKLEALSGETFQQLCARINSHVTVERSGEKTAADKEFDLLTSIPRPLLQMGTRFLAWLDDHNLLPGAFIKGDAFYTSMFIANLGSIGMAAAYHHLYEWGTCPLFLMVGKIEERPMVKEGQVVIERVIPLRFSYDERIDDGLTSHYGIRTVIETLEDPAKFLGCIADDASDHFAIENAPLASIHAAKKA